MKKTYWIFGVFIAVAVALAVSFSFPGQQKGTIKIGAILPLTGAAAPWGEYDKNGIDLAVKDINASGGIGGRQVEVSIEDDHTDPKQAVSAYDKLTSLDHVQGVIGGAWDFLAQPLIPLALQNKLAFISPSNFYIAGGFELNDQSFVMLNDFDQTLAKLQPYLASSPIKKLAVVHYQSTFGNEVAKTLGSIMLQNGKQAVIDKPYTQIGNNDWKTLILGLKDSGVDGVFLDMVGNDPITFLKQAKELGFAPTVITYNGTLDSVATDADKQLIENVVVLNWQVTTPEFAAMYQKEYGTAPAKSADKYFDAVYVLAQAIANTSGPSDVAAYISQTSFKTPNSMVSFTKDHAADTTAAEVQVVRGGILQRLQ